jgi:hypothetical protein
MPRPLPPMYPKVPRKIPPVGRTIIVHAPVPELLGEEAESPEMGEVLGEEAEIPEMDEETVVVAVTPPDVPAFVILEDSEEDEEEEEPSEDEEPLEEYSEEDAADASDETPAEGTSLSGRQLRKLKKWSEDMSQRSLYSLAKGVGLDVRSRDSKEDLIKKIKEAGG